MTARRGGRGGARLAAAVVLLFGAGACLPKPKHPMPIQPPVTLDIVSHAFNDVDVYVLPSSSGSGLRLTTVTGFNKATVRIRYMQLQAGGVLQLQLHAIGTNSSWVTPALPVSPGERVVLEINSDAYGNLSRSVLYPLPDDGSGDGPGAPSPRSP